MRSGQNVGTAIGGPMYKIGGNKLAPKKSDRKRCERAQFKEY